MNQAMVFISTRQLTQVDFSDLIFKNYDLIVIACNEELIKLPRSLQNVFLQRIPVKVKSDDGVIVEYQLEEVSSIIKALDKLYDITDIICFDEGNVELAQKLRDKEFKSGILEIFRDKVSMKEYLYEMKIPIPRFIGQLNKEFDYQEIISHIGSPFVIKPKRSAGSNNIYIINDEARFISVMRNITPVIAEYEAEEYIDGDLYHCDIALWNNESIFSECTEYLCPTIDFQAGLPLGGRVMDLDGSLRNRIIAFSKNILEVMKARDGVYHMEIFIRKNQTKDLIFLEVGARPPGMLVTTMYEKATGINLLNLDILIQTKKVPVDFKFIRKQYAFYLVYPKGSGRVENIQSPPLYNSLDMIFSNLSKIGDVHDGCNSNLDFCAHVTCSGIEKKNIDQAYDYMSKFNPVIYACN